jgi:prolyl oligopeptidase
VYQPPGAFQSVIQADELRSGVLLQLGSWTSVPRSYRYHPSTHSLEEFAVAPLGPFDRLKGHVVETGFATSHDGTRVPFTFLRPERIARDGSLPVLLVAYGAYGFPDVPQYVADWGPWYEAGGADVTCHVRGGGHYGDRWHSSGRKETKPNSWLDFIACAEHLVREGYTSPERLVALGVSAGGITVGRAIVDRPDLFAGTVIENGLLDLVRLERMPSGEHQSHEFGSVATEPGFRALHAMSAFHHVEAGTSYPAILLAVALNDTRVSPWQSAKFAAALQAATSSGEPVLLRVEEEAGHMGGTPEGFRSLMADEYAFIMEQAGMPPYRPPSEEGPER